MHGFRESYLREVKPNFYLVAILVYDFNITDFDSMGELQSGTFIKQVVERIMLKVLETLWYSSANVLNDLSDLNFSEAKQMIEGGLHFQLSKRALVNVRINYGYAFEGSSNFYVTFGEAF